MGARTNYLGHVISAEGIEPQAEKVAAVKEFQSPRNVSEVRSFLGFVGYYRRFIPDFSALAKPLNTLLKKTTPWAWGAREEEVFNTLKEKLVTAPILAMPKEGLPWTLRTDASYVPIPV